ncbi:MAG: hypothetical protein NWF13_10105 [Candidatus Bathyarchaeota archaeon]|nr:hypothetical protein [Candidatus Bathyarchaeota archaeon]
MNSEIRVVEKPLRGRGLGVDDPDVDPSPHHVYQVDVLGSLILGRSRAVQTDITRDYAYFNRVTTQKISPVLGA